VDYGPLAIAEAAMQIAAAEAGLLVNNLVGKRPLSIQAVDG